MMSRHFITIASAVSFAACSTGTPEQQVIDDAAEALGGRDRILAVQSLVLEGGGSNGNLGQDLTPDATGQTFAVSDYRRAIDVAGRRVRIEQTRTPNFTFFQGPQPQTQILGLDGDVAYNIGANGNANRASVAVAGDRRAEYYHHPLTIVRAVLDSTATVANARGLDTEPTVDVTTADGVELTLVFDAATGLPARVSSRAYNANLGDVTIETSFSGYEDVDGLQLPTNITTTTDGIQTAALRLSNQIVDGDVGDLAAPASAAEAMPATGPAPANVVVEQVAPGIWLLGGQSHHSVLVEFADHLTLIEAPQNETRTLAVIEAARGLRPNKPLTEVVVSHHHFDHSGGVRAAISEGLTIIAHSASTAYFQEIATRPHTLQPDALERNPRPATVRGVEDELVLSDGRMSVVLYPISDSEHAETFLMAYFPRERILVQADAFSPGGAVAPYARNLFDNIQSRNLRVDRIVPIHGSIVPFSALVTAVQAQAAN
jgi:glyoxylase-like metal-dependent hydrolase (beta-lactamase superfamily II)